MKAKVLIACVGLCFAATVLMTSCVQKNYYGADPNYNNNNNNNGSYTTNFDEEFNGTDVHNWTFTDAVDSAYGSVLNGSYQYVDYSTTISNMTNVNTGINPQGNFTVTTNLKANNTMGLIFGASSADNGYAFFVDTLGNYSLYKEGIGSTASTVVIPFTQDTLNVVKKGWNALEVDQTNGVWTGFINGSQVFSISARTITGAYFGFKVLPGTVGYADYLRVNSN